MTNHSITSLIVNLVLGWWQCQFRADEPSKNHVTFLWALQSCHHVTLNICIRLYFPSNTMATSKTMADYIISLPAFLLALWVYNGIQTFQCWFWTFSIFFNGCHKSLVGLVGKDNPSSSPWCIWFLVPGQKSVGAIFEPVLLTKS